jgi:hypothetical protein
VGKEKIKLIFRLAISILPDERWAPQFKCFILSGPEMFHLRFENGVVGP